MQYAHIQPDQAFRDCFNRKPFLFSHNLNTNDLFSMGSVETLANLWAGDAQRSGFFLLDGNLEVWGSDAHKAAMGKAFRDTATSKMRLKLSSVHLQPGYGALLDSCTKDLTDLTGVDLPKTFMTPLATLFISSPNELTPYHMDSEANFLLQLAGSKTVYVFDGNDRELLKWSDIENYWYKNVGIPLNDDMRKRGVPFELKAGMGLHIPEQFPHLVENGPTPSMSLSVAYEPSKDKADVLHINYHMRKLGLNPTPPGKVKVFDSTKIAVASGARTLKNTLKHLQSK